MKTLLYIGHSYHKKTKSADFILEILENKYKITTLYFDPYIDSWSIFNDLNAQEYDTVVLWQIMPSLTLLSQKIKYKKIVFFPMYDGVPPLKNSIWEEYIQANIINFSKTLHTKLLAEGFSSYYIQYFPKPLDFSNWGDTNSVYFWQRIPNININTVEKLLDTKFIKHLHFHKAIDPGYEIVEPSNEWDKKISYSTWYDTRMEMQKDMENYALYIAPRQYEGIGMSFLEAMAMGRCVIAPNNPTMNEYIEHGRTGFLYNLKKLDRLHLKNIAEIQRNTFEYITKGYEQFEKEKHNILHWVANDPKPNQQKFYWYKLKSFLKKYASFLYKKTKSTNTTRIKICGIQIVKVVKS